MPLTKLCWAASTIFPANGRAAGTSRATPSALPSESSTLARSDPGTVPRSRSPTLGRNAEARIEPSSATPTAPPTWRVVSFIAEPTPAFARGNDPMIDSVAGATTWAMPNALNAVTVMTHHAAVSVWNVAMSTSDSDEDEQPGRDDGLVAEHAHPSRRHRGEDHQHDRLREEHRAGLDRRVAEHLLHVLREQEDGAEQREERQRDRAARGREARVLEEAHVEHRVRRCAAPTRRTRRGPRRRSRSRRGPSATSSRCSAPSMMAQSRTRRGRRSTGATRAGRACRRAGPWSRARAGSRRRARCTTTGTFTRNTEPHQKCCEQHAAQRSGRWRCRWPTRRPTRRSPWRARGDRGTRS